MSSRIEIEITSKTDPDQHNWRALGAREPKGTIDSSLLPKSVQIGDSFRVEADFLIDGIEILRVLPKKESRKTPEILEVFGSTLDSPGVTTALVKKKRKKRREKGSKNRERVRSAKPSRDGNQKKQTTKPSDKRKPVNVRKKANPPRGKRLKAKRTHRKKVITKLPDLHQPLAKEIVSGGIPNLRKTLKEMDLPEGFDTEILRYAEKINADVKTAEWRDRAEAILQKSSEVDLRDFRSVVAASGQWARSDELSRIKADLEEALKNRIDVDHKKWLSEIDKAISEGKTVRALNLTSHPPRPGNPLPEGLSEKLLSLANSSLNSESSPHRWAVVVQAVAYSPIRLKVKPEGQPERITDELLSTVRALADRIPAIAGSLEALNEEYSQAASK